MKQIVLNIRNPSTLYEVDKTNF